MGRGSQTVNNPLYGKALPRGTQPSHPLSIPPQEPLSPEARLPEGARVRFISGSTSNPQNIPVGSAGTVQSRESVTGNYWVTFDGRPTDDIVFPSEISVI